jgi:hypothetical protein
MSVSHHIFLCLVSLKSLPDKGFTGYVPLPGTDVNYGWIEGVHFVRLNSSSVRYNLTLLQDWLMNRHNPLAHHRAVEAYCLVISHQKKSRKRAIV